MIYHCLIISKFNQIYSSRNSGVNNIFFIKAMKFQNHFILNQLFQHHFILNIYSNFYFIHAN